MNAIRRLIHRLRNQHTWQYYPAEVAAGGRVCGPWMYCPVCDTTIRALDEPPLGHPESMSRLPLEQEKQLAALEAVLAKEAA